VMTYSSGKWRKLGTLLGKRPEVFILGNV